MPLVDIHLISLAPNCATSEFITALRTSSVKTLSTAHVLRWMILPATKSTAALLRQGIRWDLLIILENNASLPSAVRSKIGVSWSATCGVPKALVKEYSTLNNHLIKSESDYTAIPDIPMPNSSSSQKLQLSPELADYARSLPPCLSYQPVSMLNLLSFNDGKKDQYKKYGDAFIRRVGSRHGGKVKLVGNVVSGEANLDGWDEMAFVHYPSLRHFAAMAGSEDYQQMNERYRLGSLKDTFILCVMELDGQGELIKSGSVGDETAKL